MSEEAGGYDNGIVIDTAERTREHGLFKEELRKPQNEEEGILFDLAGRYDVDKAPPVSFLEAKTLIKAVETDMEERGGWFKGRDDILLHPKSLELTQRALAKASDGTEDFTRGEMRAARAYFRWKRDYWTEGNEDLPPEFAYRLRRVYGDVLKQLNEEMPVPESVLPVPPTEPGFISTNKILIPLFKEDPATGEASLKETLEKDDILACYKAMQTDIELQKPPETVMHTAVEKGRDYFDTEIEKWKETYEERNAEWEEKRRERYDQEGIDIGPLPPYDAICVAVIGSDGESVAIKPYQIGKKYTQHTADGDSQFILDMTTEHPFTNDNEFARRIVMYDDVKASAGRAVPAIQTLFENPSQIGEKERHDIGLGLARLAKFVDPEDRIQIEAVENLVNAVGVKMIAEGIIPDPFAEPLDDDAVN